MISLFYGTRPEYIKIEPVAAALAQRGLAHELVFTGQHLTLIDDDAKIDRRFEIRDSGDNRLDSIVASCLTGPFLEDTRLVFVQGDTASAFGIALSAFHRGLPVAHLEAGMRTYDLDNPYPEEYYRRAISNLSRYHFCATDLNADSLSRERAPGEVFVVGNTVLDSIATEGNRYGDEVLVTLHRRENHESMARWFDALETAATNHPELSFVLPLHHNPAVARHRDRLQAVKARDALSRVELLDILRVCRFVVTDSGGIQEESSYLGKRSIVCRKKTERVEGLGTFSVLCVEPEDLADHVSRMAEDFTVDAPCPYGDGRSSERIAALLDEVILPAL